MLLYLICSCVEKKVTSKTVQKIINLCGIFGVGGNYFLGISFIIFVVMYSTGCPNFFYYLNNNFIGRRLI